MLALFFLSLFIAGCTAISVTESSSTFVIDTESDAGFVVTVRTTDGSLTSIKYGGTEYQYSSTYSHIASGLGSSNVSYTTSGDYVIVSTVTSSASFNLTHYYVFADGQNHIYMGTYTVDEPSVGELRYIARLVNLPNAYKNGNVSDIAGGTAIEASDVYLVDDETRSKFYSSERFIDTDTYCAYNTGETVYACWVASNIQAFEKSSGGPFHRDINLNLVSSYQSLTFYMNSGHVQTEDNRMGFHGPYTLVFGSAPPVASNIDISFFDDLDGLTGYAPASDRGYVKGTASGTSSDFPIVVHWYNDDYQFWCNASDDGSFTSPAIVKGSYTMALYQQELLAATTTVSVVAQSTATATISATNAIITASRTTIFQIGDYDGKPDGLLNANLQLRMHPSDERMSNWSIGTFDADNDAASAFPMALFKDVNSPQAITFTLDNDLDEAATIRVASTLSFNGGRSQVTVNDYACAIPTAPSKIDSRGVTRGAYRGYGDVWECTIPSGNIVAGTNNISISVVSGSSGDEWLSPNFIIDAIELFY